MMSSASAIVYTSLLILRAALGSNRDPPWDIGLKTQLFPENVSNPNGIEVVFTFNGSYNAENDITSYVIRAISTNIECPEICPSIDSCRCIGLSSGSILFKITPRNSFCETGQSCPNIPFAIRCMPEDLGRPIVDSDPSKCPYINGTVAIENGFGCFRPDGGIGSSASYRCNKGYSLSENIERRCHNGTWSGSRPNCRKSSLTGGETAAVVIAVIVVIVVIVVVCGIVIIFIVLVKKKKIRLNILTLKQNNKPPNNKPDSNVHFDNNSETPKVSLE